MGMYTHMMSGYEWFSRLRVVPTEASTIAMEKKQPSPRPDMISSQTFSILICTHKFIYIFDDSPSFSRRFRCFRFWYLIFLSCVCICQSQYILSWAYRKKKLEIFTWFCCCCLGCCCMKRISRMKNLNIRSNVYHFLAVVCCRECVALHFILLIFILVWHSRRTLIWREMHLRVSHSACLYCQQKMCA